MLMPADPFEGVLTLDEDGYRTDSAGRLYGRQDEKRIEFFDSRGQSSRVSVKLDTIQSVRPSDDPELHAVIVGYDDDVEVTYYGLDYDPTQFTVTPERHGGIFHDMDAVLRTHCPNLNSMLWSDILTGDCHLDNGILGGQHYDRDLDESVVDVCRFIGDKSKLMWGKPMNVTTSNCRSYLESEALKNKRNPFLEKIEAHARGYTPMMDGESSAYSLLARVGMLAPVLDEDDAEAYLETVNRSILLAVIQRQYEDVDVPMAPCLIGEQGSGKTSLCRFLGGKWYRASTQDVHNTKQFMESVIGGVVVEFREGLQMMNPETLKDFLDSEVVQYRKAYDRKAKTYRIPFVTIMTTNDPNPLHDLTGARRIYPMYMRKDMPGIVRPYELTEKDWIGMWARAYHDYHHNGMRWRDGMKDIEKPAEKMQAYASTLPPHYDEMKEALMRWPDVDNLIPISGIKEVLRKEIGLSDRSILEALDGLRKNPMTYGLRKWPRPFNYGGRTERGYVRTEKME